MFSYNIDIRKYQQFVSWLSVSLWFLENSRDLVKCHFFAFWSTVTSDGGDTDY